MTAAHPVAAAEALVADWVHTDTAGRQRLRHTLAAALATIAVDNPARAVELADYITAGIERPVWTKAARPAQLAPGQPGAELDRTDWDTWAIIAGRGFGKTRTGAEWSAEQLTHRGQRFALVASSFAAGRDDMVEGESGLLRCLPPSLLLDGSVERSWNRSHGRLKLANGSTARIFSAEKPGQLRGPQHHGAWVDELAKFKDANVATTDDSTWSNLALTMRLGAHPRIVVTTTPRPCLSLIGTREKPADGILYNPGTVVTTGTTYDNLANLAGTFRRRILQFEGTRLGRQELLAEILTDIEGALWTSHLLESGRVAPGYETGQGGGIRRLVIGVDPSVGQGHAENDECGIVAAGIGYDGRGYVLADRSGHMSPMEWARAAVHLYKSLDADRIVAEANQGYELVREMIRVVDPRVPVTLVHAKRGKYTRAEPVAGLYENGSVCHAGLYPKLEDQMTRYVPSDPNMDSPDRMDAAVYALSELFGLGNTDGPSSMGSTKRAPAPR